MICILIAYIVTIIIGWFLQRSNCKYYQYADFEDVLIIFIPLLNLIVPIIGLLSQSGRNFNKFFRI